MAGAERWVWACICGKGGVAEGEDAVRRIAEDHATMLTTEIIFTMSNPSGHLQAHSVFIGPARDQARVSAPQLTWASRSCAGSE